MQNELEKGILRYVDSSIENAPYTQIYTGLIKASGVDGYTIDLNGVEYTNVPSEGSFSTNDTVKVVIPNNQPSNMFILAESTGGGGGTGAVSSVNGMIGDVVISNVSSADKLSSAKTITLSGDATGSVSTDFSTNPTISVTVVDDSHNHIISNVDGLQTELDGKSNIGHYHTTDRDRANHTGTQLASTISNFASTVRSTVLTGLSTATNAVISATDTVLSALGKLQAQITANLSTLTTHIGRTNNPHSVTKTQVGLGNVDNTSDVDKPISTAQQEEFDKINNNLVDVKNDSYISSDIVFENLTLNSRTANSTVSGNLMTIPKDTNCGGSYFGYRCNVSDTVKGKTIEVKISFDDTIKQSFPNKNYTVYTILTNNEGVSLVEVKNNNGIVTYVVDIDDNATAGYIVFVCVLAYYGSFSTEQSITVNDYSIDVYTNNQRVNIKIDNAIDEKTKGIYSNYVSKQLACFGDSYTQQARWQPYVVEKLFLSGFDGFSQSGGTLTSIYTEISGLNTNSDIVTIWIGTNDYSGNRKIGTLLDDVSDETIKDAWGYTTFCGALNYVCSWLSTNMSGKTIVFITPTYRHNANDDTRLTDYGKNDKGYILNGVGASLEDYANAMIMVSNYWGFPCLDLFHNSGINDITYPSFYQSDRLHPSDAGAEKLARKIAMFINMN